MITCEKIEMKKYIMLVVVFLSLAVAADAYDLKALVEPITFSCELRDVRLTRVIDKMSSGELSATRMTKSSSDKWTDSSGTRSTTESTTGNSSSTHNEDGHRSGVRFDAGGGVKWGLIPYGKVGGEYSKDGFDELRRSTDNTASNKRGNSTSNSTANERITVEGQDTTSESTNESRLGGYMLVFSVALRNMDASDRLKVEGAHMWAQLSSDELPGAITAQYKERDDFWLGAEETICRFVCSVEDMDMLKALLRLEKEGRLGQLKLSRSGADIVVMSERTGRNVLSDLNAAEAHRPGTRFSVEFGELMTLPDWRVSHRHSAQSGPRGKRVNIHESLLALQSKAIEQSEVLPTNIFTFADDGSLVKIVDRPLLDEDSKGNYRMFALRLTKPNGATELCLPNAEIMGVEIANYMKVALFSFNLEEFVNVSFNAHEYFSTLKNDVEKYLESLDDKKVFNVYKDLLGKRIQEEDARPLPKDITTITAADVKRYKQRAEAGIPNMQFKLARCLFAGHGVVKDAVEAVKWYRKAADQGHPEAQNSLGDCYYEGEGIEKNTVEAVRWYRKAADQGLAEAQNNLGSCYYHGDGVGKDAVEAVRWFRKAVDQGDAVAQYSLGVCYDYGKGVTKDTVEAVRWYRKAADQGFAAAQYNLGMCYYHGKVVAKDAVEAVRWLRKAADQGFAEAQNNLGVCYHAGEGVGKDAVEAVKWYRKAADQGRPEAQNSLGDCYYEGEGIEKNTVEAVRWYRKAADQGFAEAQYSLGMCYCHGEGVGKDEGAAVKWWRAAAKQGHEASQNKLRLMGIEDSRNAPHQLRREPLEHVKPQGNVVKFNAAKTGDTKTITLPGGATLEMIYVSPGSFMMGSERGSDDEKPVHKVTLTKGFWLGKYEITQAQWKSVMGSVEFEPRLFWPSSPAFPGENRPMDIVSWYDCQNFIKKVNEKWGRDIARLPTEAEWEYACRAGTTGDYSGTGNLSEMGWHHGEIWGVRAIGNSDDRTHNVGEKRANHWGFCDMHGNVNEWCNDWYGYYPYDDCTNPAGPSSGEDHVRRGGSWDSGSWACTSSFRSRGPATIMSEVKDCGFRLCCSAE